MQALCTVIMTQRFVAVKKIQTRFELSRDQEFVSKKGVYSRWLSEIYYDILRWWVKLGHKYKYNISYVQFPC